MRDSIVIVEQEERIRNSEESNGLAPELWIEVGQIPQTPWNEKK